MVLIETYWNVKTDEAAVVDDVQKSINRNILECKVLSKFFQHRIVKRINRNILECKEVG